MQNVDHSIARNFTNARLKAIIRAVHGPDFAAELEHRSTIVRLAEPFLLWPPFFAGEIPRDVWVAVAEFLDPSARFAMMRVSKRLSILFSARIPAAACLRETFVDIADLMRDRRPDVRKAVARMLFEPSKQSRGTLTRADLFIVEHQTFALLVPHAYTYMDSQALRMIAAHLERACGGCRFGDCNDRVMANLARHTTFPRASTLACPVFVKAARVYDCVLMPANFALPAMRLMLCCIEFGLPIIVDNRATLPVKTAAKLTAFAKKCNADISVLAERREKRETKLTRRRYIEEDVRPFTEFASSAKAKCEKTAALVDAYLAGKL